MNDTPKNTRPMTGRERMLTTLRHEQPDRVPHFEVMFELEQEAFGLAFPDRHAWADCTPDEKARMIDRCMAIYARIVETYRWDALAVFWPWSDPDGVIAAKKTFGESILVGSIVGATLHSIEGITDWTDFAVKLHEHPDQLHAEAREKVRRGIAAFDRLIDAGADFIHIVNDVAFNGGPFISPAQFAELITPYLAEQVEHIKKRGCIPFIHSDGNLMPVFDQWLSVGAACYQSVDPMAGMDIAEVKRLSRGKLALMGNVQCSTLQDGPDQAICDSARYCLEHGAPGGGYVFGTSNTVFPGMPLRNYELMLSVLDEYNREHYGETG